MWNSSTKNYFLSLKILHKWKFKTLGYLRHYTDKNNNSKFNSSITQSPMPD